MKSRKLFFLFALVLVFGTSPNWAVAQDTKPDAKEAAAIKAVQSAGGRVANISAADAQKEVSFHLSDKPIGDEQITMLKDIKDIVWLNLANTKITDAGLKHIANLPLTKLHLEKTGIGDEGLKHLKTLKDLQYLNVYSTKVSDAGLEHLKGLKNLKKLYVWQSQVTPEGMDSLSKAVAGIEVVGEIKLAAKVVEVPKETVAVKLDLRKVKCMIMTKNPVKEEFAADFAGAKVYFCCKNCLAKFNKDKDKFTVLANQQLVQTDQFKQKACPLTGKAANDDQVVKVNLIDVKVCCGNCKKTLVDAADDAARAQLVFSKDAFAKGFEKN